MSHATIGRARRRAMLALAAAAAVISNRSARGDDFNWNSSVHSGDWSVSADWTDFEDSANPGPPSYYDNAYIGFGDAVTVSTDESANALGLGYDYTGTEQPVAGGTLTVNNSGNTLSFFGGNVQDGNGSALTVENSAGLNSVGNMSVDGTSTLTVKNSASVSFVGAELSVDTGSSLSIKNNGKLFGTYLSVGNTGAASMTLTGSNENSYVGVGGGKISNGGSVVINDAQLDATQTDFINGSSGNINFFFSPGEFDVGGSGAAASMTVTNDGEMDCLAMDISNASTVTVESGGTMEVGPAGTSTVASGYSLTVEGGSSVIIENGGQIDDGGSFQVGSNNDGTTGTLTVESGSYVDAESFSVFNTGSTAVVDGEGSFIRANLLSAGGGNLTVQDAGEMADTLGAAFAGSIVTVTGGGSTWTNGNLDIGYTGNGWGSLVVQNGGSVSASGTIIDDYGSSVYVSGVGTYGGASSLTAAGNFYVGYSTLASVNVQAGAYVSDLNGFVGYLPTSTGSSALIVDSIWNNTQGLYINAGGTLSLQVGATVTAASGSAASTSSISILSGSTLAISGVFVNSAVNANAIVDDGTAIFGSLTGNGGVALNLGGTLAFNPSGVGTLANVVTGTGALVMSGAGELVVTSSNFSLDGTVDVSDGTLQLENPSSAIGTSSLEVDAAGRVDLDGHPLTVTSLTGSGVVDNLGPGSLVAPTLTVNSTVNSAFYGSIRNSVGTVSLTKSGGGTLALYGIDTYGGTTTVNSGATLLLGSTGALPVDGNVVNNGYLLVNANTIDGTETGTGTTVTAPGVTLTADFTQGALINNGTTVLSGASQIGAISGGGALTLTPSATLKLTGNGISTVNSLTISSGGALDVGNGGLAINFGSPANDPINTIVSELSAGYHGATAWAGTSVSGGVITSSTAAAGGKSVSVGYLDGNIDTTDRSEVAANQIVVKYTLTGDTNLDGIVNFTDFATVLKNFAQPGTDWAQGNFTYNPNSPSIQGTNFTDFADVLANFLQPLPGGGAGEMLGGTATGLSVDVEIQSTGVMLPEPASLSVVLCGAAMLLRRKRRQA